MRLKLDENLGATIARLFVGAGHDVTTVVGQGLGGADDQRIARVCGEEERALVTLDLDFCNPLVYPPENYRGLVVLRPGPRFTETGIAQAAVTVIGAMADGHSPDRLLWVAQAQRIRVFDPE